MKLTGPWSRVRVDAFLASCRKPIRVACNGESGGPVIASLWFLPEDGALWCATPASARVVKLLTADPRCAFELAIDEPPYRGVRGQGTARLVPERGVELLDRLIDRHLEDSGSDFAAWLRSRATDETAIEITPERMLSWDFAGRMAGVETR